jgi:hypothetical protein
MCPNLPRMAKSPFWPKPRLIFCKKRRSRERELVSCSLRVLLVRRCRAFRLFDETAAQEREDGSLFRFQTLDSAAQFALGLRLELKHKVAVHVAIQHFRMHVAPAADGRRIAKPPGQFFDGSAQIALGLSGAVEALKLIERDRRKDRSGPGAESFAVISLPVISLR